jgi:zinc transport system ATP-binding protein
VPTDRPADGQQAETLIRLSGISLRHGDRQTLERVDVEVRRGEIVTVIGPNGSGKTTLVRAALGLIKPDEGAVIRSPGLRIGYVPQHLGVDRTLPLTVRRFLALSGATSGEEHERALAEVGVGYALDGPFQALSGGEAKRVTLARALLRRPDLLVLDEPTSNVDVAGQAEFYDLIRVIRDQRDCGILLVSHDLHLVMRATDTVVCLNGHVCCSGRPDSVSRDPEYLALFGPRVAETLGIYAHDHDHRHDLAGEPVTAPDAAPNATPGAATGPDRG